MTLDEFKTMLNTQRRKTAMLLDLANSRKALCDANLDMSDAIIGYANTPEHVSKITLYDIKLDMLDAIICMASTIEQPQTKMREFL